MRTLLLIGCCLLAAPLLAEEAKVYKKVQPDGSVEFSDAPTRGATTVEVPPLQTYTPPPVAPPRVEPAPAPAPAPVARYEELRITQPADDGTVFFDEKGMPVAVLVKPDLQPGHHVVLFLDGRQVARGTDTRFVLTDVFRGTHTLTAQVEAAGVVLRRSPQVTFHLIQHSKRP